MNHFNDVAMLPNLIELFQKYKIKIKKKLNLTIWQNDQTMIRDIIVILNNSKKLDRFIKKQKKLCINICMYTIDSIVA